MGASGGLGVSMGAWAYSQYTHGVMGSDDSGCSDPDGDDVLGGGPYRYAPGDTVNLCVGLQTRIQQQFPQTTNWTYIKLRAYDFNPVGTGVQLGTDANDSITLTRANDPDGATYQQISSDEYWTWNFPVQTFRMDALPLNGAADTNRTGAFELGVEMGLDTIATATASPTRR